jgi:hypothetical protein
VRNVRHNAWRADLPGFRFKPAKMGEHYGLGSLITDDLPHGWVTLVCPPVAESGPGKRTGRPSPRSAGRDLADRDRARVASNDYFWGKMHARRTAALGATSQFAGVPAKDGCFPIWLFAAVSKGRSDRTTEGSTDASGRPRKSRVPAAYVCRVGTSVTRFQTYWIRDRLS